MTYVQRLPQPETPVAGPSGQTFALIVVAAAHLLLVVLVASQLEHVRLPWGDTYVPPDIVLLPPVKKQPPTETRVEAQVESTTVTFPPPELPDDFVDTPEEPVNLPPRAPDNGGYPGRVGRRSGPPRRASPPGPGPPHHPAPVPAHLGAAR